MVATVNGSDQTRVVEVEALDAGYNGNPVVRDLSLHIGPGEVVALLGANGAGKTTTLLMLLGVVAPDAGTVDLVGHRLPRGRTEALANVGFAAGYLPLTERMRVREFLRMYGQLSGLVDPSAAIEAALERFKISHLAHALGTELSSGQRTLVGIVKATLHQPRLLVLDEPTASLDPDVASRVREGLLDLSQHQDTALLVTSHDMTEVERLCERVVFMSRGRVVADGSPAEVTARFGRGRLEEVFLHLAGNDLPPGSAGAQETDRPA
jgi:ABC-2 type transport system ATP-binding protein